MPLVKDLDNQTEANGIYPYFNQSEAELASTSRPRLGFVKVAQWEPR